MEASLLSESLSYPRLVGMCTNLTSVAYFSSQPHKIAIAVMAASMCILVAQGLGFTLPSVLKSVAAGGGELCMG